MTQPCGANNALLACWNDIKKTNISAIGMTRHYYYLLEEYGQQAFCLEGQQRGTTSV